VSRESVDFKVWFREDIARVLDGVRIASATLPPAERVGFDLALKSVARVIGVPQQFAAPPHMRIAQVVDQVVEREELNW
jgi:hypothetical protein